MGRTAGCWEQRAGTAWGRLASDDMLASRLCKYSCSRDPYAMQSREQTKHVILTTAEASSSQMCAGSCLGIQRELQG